jgi:hypothetical protein
LQRWSQGLLIADFGFRIADFGLRISDLKDNKRETQKSEADNQIKDQKPATRDQ